MKKAKVLKVYKEYVNALEKVASMLDYNSDEYSEILEKHIVTSVNFEELEREAHLTLLSLQND